MLTSSLGKARIPGAPWSVKYTNTLSLGPLPNQRQECLKRDYISTSQVVCGTFFCVCVCFFFFTHLFSTFPEPPLTAEALPFSTARKFCGVTSCGGGAGGQQQHTSQKSKQAGLLTLLQNIYVSFIHRLSRTSLV